MNLDRARTVADAVLYEGYLLYPYRATSAKNRVRWQFGVLGPPGAAEEGLGEDPRLATQCLLHAPLEEPEPGVTVHLRFLQLQQRSLEQAPPAEPSRWEAAHQLVIDGQLLYSFEEAVAHEIILPRARLSELAGTVRHPVAVAGGKDVEGLESAGESGPGRIVRTRWPLAAEVAIGADAVR